MFEMDTENIDGQMFRELYVEFGQMFRELMDCQDWISNIGVSDSMLVMDQYLWSVFRIIELPKLKPAQDKTKTKMEF